MYRTTTYCVFNYYNEVVWPENCQNQFIFFSFCRQWEALCRFLLCYRCAYRVSLSHIKWITDPMTHLVENFSNGFTAYNENLLLILWSSIYEKCIFYSFAMNSWHHFLLFTGDVVIFIESARNFYEIKSGLAYIRVLGGVGGCVNLSNYKKGDIKIYFQNNNNLVMFYWKKAHCNSSSSLHYLRYTVLVAIIRIF